MITEEEEEEDFEETNTNDAHVLQHIRSLSLCSRKPSLLSLVVVVVVVVFIET